MIIVLFLFSLHPSLHLFLLTPSRVSFWLRVYPFPFFSHYCPPSPHHLPVRLFHGSHGSGAAVEPCREHMWSGPTRIIVPFGQNSTGWAETPPTGLHLSKGTSFSQLPKGTVWARVSPGGSDLWRPEVETKSLPSEFLFTYSWQVIALLFLEKTPWTSQKRRDCCSCILMQWMCRNRNYMNIVSLEHTSVAIWKENTQKEPTVYFVLSDFRGRRK